MTTLIFDTQQKHSYEITIEPGLLKKLGPLLLKLKPDGGRVCVITDKNIHTLHFFTLAQSLKHSGFEVDVFVLDPGEKSKSIEVAIRLWSFLIEIGFRRRTLILALGGGVVTDLAGFVASAYMRGVPYINIPTSLIAQLDAATGSKVAVNHEHAKNLIGSFYHPEAVWIDPNLLKTLPVSELKNGFSEAVKVAVITSEFMFKFIEENSNHLISGDITNLTELIINSIKEKINLLVPDLYEMNLKRGLNFGHTFGHAIETATSYTNISHGQAVAIGMATALRMAESKGICPSLIVHRIITLLEKLGLPTKASKGTPEDIWQRLTIIKEIRNGFFHEVLPTRFGEYIFSNDITQEDIKRYMYFSES